MLLEVLAASPPADAATGDARWMAVALCTGALLHAQVARVVVGTVRADLPRVFRQRAVGFRELLDDASRPPALRVGVLRDRGLALFARLGGRPFELGGCAHGCC